MSARFRDALAQQAKAAPLDSILASLDVLNTTKLRLRGSGHGRILVEMALIRLSRLDDLVSLAQVAQWLSQPQAAGPALNKPALPGKIASAVAPPEGEKKKPDPPGEKPQAAVRCDAQSLPAIWSQAVTQMPGFFANALERAGLPAISGPNTLVLRFPADYNSEREYCQDAVRLSRLEQALAKGTGTKWSLRVEAAPKATTPTPVTASDDGTAQPSRARRQRAEAAQEPLIKRALEILEAQIVSVDEGFGAAPIASSERPEAEASEEA